MVLVVKGFDLKSGEWTLWANEPDLDTVLAIWVLLRGNRPISMRRISSRSWIMFFRIALCSAMTAKMDRCLSDREPPLPMSSSLV